MGKVAAETKERARTVLFMCAVTLVLTSCVSFLHLITRGAVERNEYLFLKKAVMEVTGVTVPTNPDDIHAWYDACVIDRSGDDAYFTIRDPMTGVTRGHAFVRSGAGLWGQIKAMVGLDADMAKVTGVAFMEHNETPGLGARISESWFKDQFRGKSGPFRLVPEGTRSSVPEEVDAITGATITSAAVRDIVNGTLEDAKEHKAHSG